MENKRKNLHDRNTHNRIHEHLSDKSDVISEEDIKNAKTNNFDEDQRVVDTSSANPDTDDQNKAKPLEKEGEEDTGMVTPWNILGS